MPKLCAGGLEQAGGEPDGERHGAVAEGAGAALPPAREAHAEEAPAPPRSASRSGWMD